jgi:hypothetical protein
MKAIACSLFFLAGAVLYSTSAVASVLAHRDVSGTIFSPDFLVVGAIAACVMGFAAVFPKDRDGQSVKDQP